MSEIVRYLRSENIADLAGLFELAVAAIWFLGYFVFVRVIPVKTRIPKT
jgi:hypothetical protein